MRGNTLWAFEMSNPSEEFPKICSPHVVVVRAEAQTGIVLNEEGTRYIGSGTRYLVFENIAQARAYVDGQRTNPEIECWIYDENHKPIEVPEWATHLSVPEPTALEQVGDVTEGRFLMREIVPPIIVSPPDETLVFTSLEDALRYLEPAIIAKLKPTFLIRKEIF